MSKNYKINEITFSTRTDIDKGPKEGAPEEERNSPQESKRRTILVAHVSFEYWSKNLEYGTALVDLAEVCSVDINSNGNLIKFNQGDSADEITAEVVMSKAEEAVKEIVTSIDCRDAEVSQINSFLNKVRSMKGLPRQYIKSSLYDDFDDSIL